MIIKSISINNFMCYYGDSNVFEFTKGLNIVLGANGYGKSKLYDAFQWVFNDQVTDSNPNNKTGHKGTSLAKRGLISEKALAEANIGDTIECKVTIEALRLDSNSETYKIVRSYSCRKTDEDQWFEPIESRLMIYKKDILNYMPVSEHENGGVLERLLPTEVRPYVWFQGERGINALIDTSSEESLKNVIKRLSDISKWNEYIKTAEKASESAKNAFDQQMKSARRNRERIEKLQNDQATHEREVAKYDRLIEENKKNLKAAQDKQEQFTAQIENATNMKKLQLEEQGISNELSRVISAIDIAYQNFNRKMFSNHWLLSGTESIMQKFDKKFQDYNDAVNLRKATENLKREAEKHLQTRLPDGVPEPIHIQKMIDIEFCLVCDRPAKKDTPEYLAIKSLLPVNKPEEAEPVKALQYQMLNDLYHNNMAVKDHVNSAQEDIREEILSITGNQTRKRQLEEELEQKGLDIQEQLRLGGSTNPGGIIDSWKITSADISKYSTDLAKDEAARETSLRALRAVQAELGQLSKGEIPESFVIKRDILADLHALTIRVKDTKYKELIQILETKANEHFQRINFETGAFYGRIKFIEISEGGYRPIIVDPGQNNSDITGSLNTSVVSAMKLSIIMAIVSANANRSYTQFYPLISDAPVSDFDPVKTKAFLLESAQTFNQSIIIMKEGLVKDDARQLRYKPEMEKLFELNEELNTKNIPLKVYQIDMPEGISNRNRSEIAIDIKKILN